MGCPHEAWERDVAAEADGLCPLCLQAMLELSDRRLQDSERLRTNLAAEIDRLRKRVNELEK